jgi:hypothetical protein
LPTDDEDFNASRQKKSPISLIGLGLLSSAAYNVNNLKIVVRWCFIGVVRTIDDFL